MPNELLLFKLLLLLLICNDDGCERGGIDGAAVFVGLCIFNWFIDSDGPDDFDLPDIKFSKSIPTFDHVGPTIGAGELSGCLLSFTLVEDCGRRMLFVGCRISAGKSQVEFIW